MRTEHSRSASIAGDNRQAENPYQAPAEGGRATEDHQNLPIGNSPFNWIFAVVCYLAALGMLLVGSVGLIADVARRVQPADAFERYSAGLVGAVFLGLGVWLVWRGNCARREARLPRNQGDSKQARGHKDF